MSAATSKNFIEQFCSAFEMYSYNNQLYGRLCAHVLLGQALRNIKLYFGPLYIDPRISLFFIQPSGTGKSVPYSFIKDIGEKSQIFVDDVDEATDAALIGHYETEETLDPETRTKIITHKKIVGKLANADILHYDEGQMLIKGRSQYALNTLTWFQKALNPIGSGQNICKKSLAPGDIEIHPTCSLLITSHEIDNLIETVLETGFLQRIVLYPRYVPIIERKGNELSRADRFGRRVFSQIDVEAISEKLVKVRKKYEGYDVQVDPNFYPIIKSKINELYILLDTLHERVREIMATFLPRYDNLMYIFALHHMCVEFKDVLDIEDAKYGTYYAHLLFKEIMVWVEENIPLVRLSSKEQSYLNSAFLIYKTMQMGKDNYVMRVSLTKACSIKWKLSMPTVIHYFEKFKGYGKMKEVDESGTKFVKIEI